MPLYYRYLVQIALISVLIFAPFRALAQTVSIDHVDIVEKGIYQLDIASKTQSDSSPTGQHNTVTGIRKIEQTTTISARLGMHFGLRYMVVGEPKDALVPITIVTIFPKQGVYNPDKRQTFYRDERTTNRTVGKVSYTGYTFENPWELVPGVWTFQFWYQGRQLAEQSFTVVKP